MLKKLIAHQIIKEAHSNTASTVLRDSLLPLDAADTGLSTVLFSQLQSSFRSQNPVSGKFRSIGNAQPIYQQLLSEYLANDSESAGGFLTFTINAMEHLRNIMSREPLATGGYVIFLEYEASGVTFLTVAILTGKAQPTFDEHLNLVAAITPDLTHLRHAARVRLPYVETNEDGAVQFISPRSSRISDYFVEFIGCEEITRPEVQGRRLYSTLNAWASNNHYSDDQRSALLGRAYTHWKDCHREGRQMTLTALSNALQPENPNAIFTHLSSEQNELSGEFSPPPPSIMKRFVRFSFNGQGIKLEFDRNEWENKIEISAADRTLTIRNVPRSLIDAISAENE